MAIANPTGTAPPRRRRRGLLVLLALVVIVGIAAGALILYSTSNAHAQVSAPASLTVFTGDVQVSHAGGTFASAKTGAAVGAGDEVRTGTGGRAGIVFPDGTATRMAPDSEIKIQTLQIQRSGGLASVHLVQLAGRSLSSVQHLLGGGSFSVTAAQANGEVRGTDFEVTVKPDGTVVFQLLSGTLDVAVDTGGHRVTLTANQQTTVPPNGNPTPPTALVPDPNDDLLLAYRAKTALADVANQGTRQSSGQSSTGLHDGETANAPDYTSPGGGTLKAALTFTGTGTMRLAVNGPAGASGTAQGPSPVTVTIPSAPAGLYHLTVTGLSGNGAPGGAGATWEVQVVTDTPCNQPVDSNGVVRRPVDAAGLIALVQTRGVSVTGGIVGASSSGALASVTGQFPIGPSTIQVTALVLIYAAPPNMAAVILSATAPGGINVGRDQVNAFLSSLQGVNLGSIPLDFNVQRVYSCSGYAVVEGTR